MKIDQSVSEVNRRKWKWLMKIWMRFRLAIAIDSVQCGFVNNKRLIYYADAHVVDT